MAVPKGRLAEARFIRQYLSSAIDSGVVAGALIASGQKDVRIGPSVSEHTPSP